MKIDEYFVIGTYDEAIWEKNLTTPIEGDEIYDYLADFENFSVLGKN